MSDSLRYSVLRISAVVLLAISAGLAAAQVSPERRQAILDYQLNLPRANQLIPAMAAMSKYVVSLPDYPDRLRKAAKMTPAEGLAAMEKDAKAMAILEQNGLAARDYLIGVPALRMAIMAAMDAADGIGSAGK